MIKRSEAGFTLAELLIVVAIIGVLVGISIPVFQGQLEKSREAVDLANVRSAYAEVMAAANSEDTSSSLYDAFDQEYRKTIYLKQKMDDWQSDTSKLNIGGVNSSDTSHWKGKVYAGGKCEVIYSIKKKDVTLKWDGYTVYPNYQWKISQDQAGNKYLTKDNKSYNAINWPASAVPEFIEAKTGQYLTVDNITQEKYPTLYQWIQQGGGYEIGFFITDKDGKILKDSGGQPLTTEGKPQEYTIAGDNIDPNADVQVAIQFFKMKKKGKDNHNEGSTTMTEAEARELEKLFKITDGNQKQ